MSEPATKERRVEDPNDPESHHPSCCGACDECLRICWGYHGRERRKVAFIYPDAPRNPE